MIFLEEIIKKWHIHTIYSGEKEAHIAEIEVMKSNVLDACEIVKIKKRGGTKIQSEVIIKVDALMPTESYYSEISDSDGFEISMFYAGDWYVKTVTEKENEQSIDLSVYYYDNESLPVIVVALSYEEIDTFKLNDVISLTAKIVLL